MNLMSGYTRRNSEDLTCIISGIAYWYFAAPFEGTYEGKPQDLNLGSYIQVGDTSALDQLGLVGKVRRKQAA
jgi:hypothetical protein